MAVAAGDSSEAEAKHQHNQLEIAIIHSDLGIGGAERLIVDAARQLTAHGKVRIFTSPP